MQEIFDDSRWYEALTLDERAPLLKNIEPERRLLHPSTLVRQRAEKWETQSQFADSALLLRRLEQSGLTEADFETVLGLTAQSLKDATAVTPDWLELLRISFASADEPPPELLQASVLSGVDRFLILLSPLVGHVLAKLERRAADLPGRELFVRGMARAIFYPGLAKQLTFLIARTAVLELHVAHYRDLLPDSSEKERFDAYIDRLGKAENALALLIEYPVLARACAECAMAWLSTSLEMLERLAADWAEIGATFSSGRDPGPLTAIRGEAGDKHRAGRSVHILELESGLQLVYKPRSLGIEARFHHLLQWLTERGAPDLYAPQVLDRGDYGWVEFVEKKPCSDRAELARFYQRHGSMLALLFVLEATDFHSENLIAMGEHPVFVDLESLFRGSTEAKFDSASEAASILFDSVLRVGLLPQREWSLDGSSSVERSGLGGAAGQLSLEPVAVWENVGTGDMRLGRRKLKMKAALNQPMVGETEANPIEFVEEIVAGFRKVASIVLSGREELLAPTGRIAGFAGLKVRYIFRHTRAYFLLMKESLHPDLLRCALDRDASLDRIWYFSRWREKQDDPLFEKYAALVPFEIRDMRAGDIPYFESCIGSRDLWDSRGERVPDFFERSGTEVVLGRLAGLDEKLLALQEQLIRGAMTTLAMDLESPKILYELDRAAPRPASADELVQEASRIADRLRALAFRNAEGLPSWIGLTMIGNHWNLSPLGTDLYAGLPGLILFLAYLDRLKGGGKYRDLIDESLVATKREIDKIENSPYMSLGAFSGLGGILYLYSHLDHLQGRGDLAEESERLIGRIGERVSTDQALDVLGGGAGTLVVLSHHYRATGSIAALEVAKAIGRHLLSQAEEVEGGGVGWKVAISPDQYLAGLSHGAAGIAWALLELFELTGDVQLAVTARKALAFESRLFSPGRGNWPDLRGTTFGSPPPTAGAKFMVAWCHGAPGIGLSRLAMRRHFAADPTGGLERDIEKALAETLRRGFGMNHSLCHGDFGNLDLFLEHARQDPAKRWLGEARRLGAAILASIRDKGWISGVPHGFETPGLMNGLAGIGYGLLRLAAPEKVPSVLLLAPPIAD